MVLNFWTAVCILVMQRPDVLFKHLSNKILFIKKTVAQTISCIASQALVFWHYPSSKLELKFFCNNLCMKLITKRLNKLCLPLAVGTVLRRGSLVRSSMFGPSWWPPRRYRHSAMTGTKNPSFEARIRSSVKDWLGLHDFSHLRIGMPFPRWKSGG
jgi:hypothetical protein